MIVCDSCGSEAVVVLIPVQQADIDCKSACSACKASLKAAMPGASETCLLPGKQLSDAVNQCETEVNGYLGKE